MSVRQSRNADLNLRNPGERMQLMIDKATSKYVTNVVFSNALSIVLQKLRNTCNYFLLCGIALFGKHCSLTAMLSD